MYVHGIYGIRVDPDDFVGIIALFQAVFNIHCIQQRDIAHMCVPIVNLIKLRVLCRGGN